jgi:hypothetical protein
MSKQEIKKEDNYRKSLLETVDYLIEVRSNLFGNALAVAMNNELKEFNEMVEVGEEYTFQIEHFDNSSDTNLQKIVDLIKTIQITVDSIMNINNIDDNELIQKR